MSCKGLATLYHCSVGGFSPTLSQLEFDTLHPPAGCDSISFSAGCPPAPINHCNPLLSAQPPPFCKQSSVHLKPALFSFSSASFFFPKAIQQNQPLYCHLGQISFLSPTLDCLLRICFTQLTTLNFND